MKILLHINMNEGKKEIFRQILRAYLMLFPKKHGKKKKEIIEVNNVAKCFMVMMRKIGGEGRKLLARKEGLKFSWFPNVIFQFSLVILRKTTRVFH